MAESYDSCNYHQSQSIIREAHNLTISVISQRQLPTLLLNNPEISHNDNLHPVTSWWLRLHLWEAMSQWTKGNAWRRPIQRKSSTRCEISYVLHACLCTKLVWIHLMGFWVLIWIRFVTCHQFYTFSSLMDKWCRSVALLLIGHLKAIWLSPVMRHMCTSFMYIWMFVGLHISPFYWRAIAWLGLFWMR
jgi:hypothetical protein